MARPETPFNPARLTNHTAAEIAFVAALAAHQERMGWDNRQMAHHMGVPWDTWRKTRLGTLRLGWLVVVAGENVVGYDVAAAAHAEMKGRTRAMLSRNGHGENGRKPRRRTKLPATA